MRRLLTEQINLRIDALTLYLLVRLCEIQGITRSALIRRLIQEAYDREIERANMSERMEVRNEGF